MQQKTTKIKRFRGLRLVVGLAVAGVLAAISMGASPALASHATGGTLSCYSSAHDPIGVPRPAASITSTTPRVNYPWPAVRQFAYIPVFGQYNAGTWKWKYGTWAVQRETESGVGPWTTYPEGKTITSQTENVERDMYYMIWNYVYDYTTRQGEWVKSHTADGKWYCATTP